MMYKAIASNMIALELQSEAIEYIKKAIDCEIDYYGTKEEY